MSTYRNVTGYPFQSDRAAGYGPESRPDLTSEMVAKATELAEETLRHTGNVDVWTRLFATGNEAVDRPMYREYKRVILNALIDGAQAKLREMNGNR